jgi:hypothetical protein
LVSLSPAVDGEVMDLSEDEMKSWHFNSEFTALLDKLGCC